MTQLAIEVKDANGDVLWNPTISVKDKYGGAHDPVPFGGGGLQPPTFVADLGQFDAFTIRWSAPGFFVSELHLVQDVKQGTFEVDARSAELGLAATERDGLLARLTLRASRVRSAPVALFAPPANDQDPPIVYDPGGIIRDANKLHIGLFSGQERGYQAVLGPSLLGDPAADDWGRFNTSTRDIDPNRADGGTSIHWLEYGDPADGGFRLPVLVWAINRAGARADRKVDVHVFYCPRTDVDFYGPARVFPYKVKRYGTAVVQPYSTLGYTYLSSGSPASGTPPGRDFGIAYQGMAAAKSHIVVMPINAYGEWGPLLCRAGLLRLVREVVSYVSDHTSNAPPPVSRFPEATRQLVNRVAVSGYSRGASDVAMLFRCASIAELANQYGAMKNDALARAFAQRLSRLPAALWQSPAADLDRSWHEFYSVDGFYDGSAATAFPAEVEKWFAAHEERILRIYATPGRMASPEETIKARLRSVFPDPKPTAEAVRPKEPDVAAREWQRSDNRATLAWFSERYMTFNAAAPRMPLADAHHTIPRIAFSHAIAQSRLLQP